jgi:starch phosphorylase
MKLALNGALTLGTADGANVEIADAVGRDNLFLFGMTVEGAAQLRSSGYDPMSVATGDRDLLMALEQIAGGEFSPDDPNRFEPVVNALLRQGDRFMVLADFADYARAGQRVDRAWLDQEGWDRMAILNIARMVCVTHMAPGPIASSGPVIACGKRHIHRGVLILESGGRSWVSRLANR